MTVKVDYKGYVLTSDARIEPDQHWRPGVIIVHFNGQEAREKILVADKPVDTMELADDLSIEMGKRWIDEHPDPFA
jgi:hypothetical protein